MTAADRGGASGRVDASATAHETNRHRWYRRRTLPSLNPAGVGCSAEGCPWVGGSVTDFYRLHLYPMMTKLRDAER